MSEPGWLVDLGETLVAKVDPADTATYAGLFSDLLNDVSGFTPASFDLLRGKFTSATMGRSLAPALANPVAITGGVQAAVAGARAVLDAPGATVASLLTQVGPLRQVSDAAWKACQVASGAVRTLKAAEKIAAAAALSGLPGVTGPWAAATNARMAAEVVAEGGARAGRAADQAFGGVLHSIDALRRQAFAAVNAVSRIADSAVGAMTLGSDLASATPAAYATLFADLQAAVTEIA